MNTTFVNISTVWLAVHEVQPDERQTDGQWSPGIRVPFLLFVTEP